ncbi:hypothetical protein FQN57_000584 [Myotisia sp. PD_48]|nr:hypothetical protein FQN57_000584 [Myotisia sp. PD_48]
MSSSSKAGSPESYYDLGVYHRSVKTSNTDAQTWFNRGLIWTYGFNHEEAATCFERAIQADPDCAMAYWGLAYALGPNYNKPWEFYEAKELETTVERTHRAAAQANEKAPMASEVEQALIHALQFRYPQDRAADDCSIWNQGFADAMQMVYEKFPLDIDVATLYADALMNLNPWKLWDVSTGKPTNGARTLEIKQVLEQAIKQEGGDAHPGLLHLYIHLMEMSNSPDEALPMGDLLRGLVPDSGHLNHMPSHIDILCGDYQRAILSNSDAIIADEKFLAREGPLNFYTLYRSHDYHFRIYAAMLSGKLRVALDTAESLENSIPEDLLRIESPPMADWLEGLLAMRVHILVRFGKWEELLAMSLPSDQNLYSVTTAMIHYGKGIAYAASGDIEKARAERETFTRALGRVSETRTIFNNQCVYILEIAAAMLDGEIEYRCGNFDQAFEYLRKSIKLDDSLPYDEPWGWMQPTRHAYGALLLERGFVEQAVAVYKADLGVDNTLPRAHQHPNNVWALHGYHECLVKLGEVDEAAKIGKQLRLAVLNAEVPIHSSCYCRLTAK